VFGEVKGTAPKGRNSQAIAPLRGFADHGNLFPGLCPGLSHLAPSGLSEQPLSGVGVPGNRRDLVGRVVLVVDAEGIAEHVRELAIGDVAGVVVGFRQGAAEGRQEKIKFPLAPADLPVYKHMYTYRRDTRG